MGGGETWLGRRRKHTWETTVATNATAALKKIAELLPPCLNAGSLVPAEARSLTDRAVASTQQLLQEFAFVRPFQMVEVVVWWFAESLRDAGSGETWKG